jgi:hypothetical protein
MAMKKRRLLAVAPFAILNLGSVASHGQTAEEFKVERKYYCRSSQTHNVGEVVIAVTEANCDLGTVQCCARARSAIQSRIQEQDPCTARDGNWWTLRFEEIQKSACPHQSY